MDEYNLYLGKLTLEELGAKLSRTFPDAGPITPVGILGSGFRSVAVETAEGWVFRIAKHPHAYGAHEKEWWLLPQLAGKLSAPVPDPKWYVGWCGEFAYGVIGYRKLPGVPVKPDSPLTDALMTTAEDLGQFLASLHGFDSGSLASPGWTWYSEAGLRELGVTMLAGSAQWFFDKGECDLLSVWSEAFRAERPMRYEPILMHGDLWYENVLVDPITGRVTGIVDFENSWLGDPAEDLATQLHLGYEFAAAVLLSYRGAGGLVNKGLLRRMRRHWELREFDGLGYAIQRNDLAERQDAITKIRHGAILDPEPHDKGFAYLESVLELT